MKIEAHTGERFDKTRQRALKVALLRREIVDFSFNDKRNYVFPKDAALIPIWQILAISIASYLPNRVKTKIQERWVK
ncbi:hypothetical protein HY612_03235 [Candidatus Roizmanbacteria bacterium]|nr:hypothetical protein [Candidatus Roizmanbacteria bacterium]